MAERMIVYRFVRLIFDVLLPAVVPTYAQMEGKTLSPSAAAASQSIRSSLFGQQLRASTP